MTVEESPLGRAMAKLGVHDHACVIFETREQQIDAQTSYIRTGLARGHRCVYAAEADGVDGVRGFLRTAGVDVDAAETQGAFAVMTARDSYLRDGAFDPDLMIEFLHGAADESESAGFPVLRGSAEMSWNLGGAPGSERLFEYEAKLNRFVQERDCTLVCQYDRGRFGPQALIEVLRTHPIVIYGDRVLVNHYYVPPDDYLASPDPERKLQRSLDRIVERNAMEAALRDAERRFRSAVEAFPGPYMIYDRNLRFVYANPAGIKACIKPWAEMVGRTVEEAFGEEMTAGYGPSLRRARDTRQPQRVEFRTPTAQGERDLETHFIPILDEAGKVTQVLGIGYDLTERYALLRELRQHEAHLEEIVSARTAELLSANEAKSRFLANMSHDLRTPLNSVIGFSGTLLQGLAGDLNEEQDRQVRMIAASGKFLLGMVNDTLDIQSIEAGRLIMSDEVFDVGTCLRQIAELERPRADQKGLSLGVRVPKKQLALRADEQRLRQVLVNLIDNAIKFTETGSVDVGAKLERDGSLRLSVRDTGRGIPAERIDEIFNEFVQLQSDGRDKSKGSGLGLAICRRLVTMMDGTLSVRSEPGVGSTFVIALPAERMAAGTPTGAV